MVYAATAALALSIIAGFLGIYNLGINMTTGFFIFWALVIVGVGILSVDTYRHGEHY